MLAKSHGMTGLPENKLFEANVDFETGGFRPCKTHSMSQELHCTLL